MALNDELWKASHLVEKVRARYRAGNKYGEIEYDKSRRKNKLDYVCACGKELPCPDHGKGTVAGEKPHKHEFSPANNPTSSDLEWCECGAFKSGETVFTPNATQTALIRDSTSNTGQTFEGTLYGKGTYHRSVVVVQLPQYGDWWTIADKDMSAVLAAHEADKQAAVRAALEELYSPVAGLDPAAYGEWVADKLIAMRHARDQTTEGTEA